MNEERSGSKRAKLLSRIFVVVVVFAINVFCISTVFSLVGAGTESPLIYALGPMYTNNPGTGGSAFASVTGEVVNPSSLTAYNVTVLFSVYAKYPVGVAISTSSLDLGSIPPGSSKSFATDVDYSGGYYALFDGIGVDLFLQSRFDFGVGFFAVVLPMAFILPLLDVYSAYRLGLFGWIKTRKKVVATTLAWSAAIALVVMVPYSLYYNGRGMAAFTTLFGQFPTLGLWDWIIVFIASIVVGVVIGGLDTVVYSFLSSLLLSVIFEVTFGSLFIWYVVGYGQSYTYTTPGESFVNYFSAVISGVFLTVLRMMTIIIPSFCILGVLIGAMARGYFDPSVDV